MAIIIIDVVMSEYEDIKELATQLRSGFISEENFRTELLKILGDAMPRTPERNDEIRLNVVKKSQVGYTGNKGKKIVH